LKFMTMSMVCPGFTSTGKGVLFTPPRISPLIKTRRYFVVHVHVPLFFKRQTLVNCDPGAKPEPSGTVTSSTDPIRSQPRFAVGVGDWNGVFVGVGVRVGVRDGVNVFVGVLDGVNVGVCDGVRVGVKVLVGVFEGVKVNVGVLVGVFVGVNVFVGVLVGVRVGVFDGV
jgi:hypothetical protein